MKAAYQQSDLEVQELGELSAAGFSRLIQDKDWTSDLMEFASRSAQLEEGCPPNFNALIDGHVALTIVPSRPMSFTIIVSKRVGSKWVGASRDFIINEVDSDDIEHVLSELEQGQFADVKQQWAK